MKCELNEKVLKNMTVLKIMYRLRKTLLPSAKSNTYANPLPSPGGGGAERRVAGRRALVDGRAGPRRPQRGLVRSVHGRRRAHVLRQVPQGVPPVLPHPHHREAARGDGVVAVPAVRELRGRRRGGGRAGGARAARGGAPHAGAVLPVRAVAGLPRARLAAQQALLPAGTARVLCAAWPAPTGITLSRVPDPAAHVPGHDPPEAAAGRGGPLHAHLAVRGRRAPALPQRLQIQPGTTSSQK